MCSFCLKVKFIKCVILLIILLTFVNGLYARDLSYWSLNGGISVSDILVDGNSFGLVAEPRFNLSPYLMIGSKNGVTYSTDEIIALEAQLYLRWNFLRFPLVRNDEGNSRSFGNSVDVFIQGGAGFLGALKGPNREYDIRDSRSSLLGDVTAGVTIPLSSRWHIEPSIRGGYPFLFGGAVTAGYKFPLIREYESVINNTVSRIEYTEVVKKLLITQIEYILFAADISRFNAGIDADARALNQLTLDHVAHILTENPDFRIRIEGNANPVTGSPEEVQYLTALSENRANEIARLLKERGVKDEQLIVIAFGTTRVIAHDRPHWNMNRRVELIIFQLD